MTDPSDTSSQASEQSLLASNVNENRSGVINPQYQCVAEGTADQYMDTTYDSTQYAQELFNAATAQPQTGAGIPAAYMDVSPIVSQPPRIMTHPAGALDGAQLAAQRRASGAAEPVYGSNYLSYDSDDKAWGNRASLYNPKKKNLDDLKGKLDENGKGAGNLTSVQVSLFGTAYDFMANSRGFVPQDVLRFYLHHLQEKRKDGTYVYMFSERQATDMMPSKTEAPEGMNYQQFLNVMYHVHQETGWSAQKILTAFSRSDGHYGNHPGHLSEAMMKAREGKDGCMVM